MGILMLLSNRLSRWFVLLCLLILSACAAERPVRPTLEPTIAVTLAVPSASPTPHASLPLTGGTARRAAEKPPVEAPTLETEAPAAPVITKTSAPTTTATTAAKDWKEWPVMPGVSETMREVYQRGLAQGNNPHAFSVLGDCQSQPEVFMGLFDSDPAAIAALLPDLHETAAQFAGSFDRYSPTVKDGTTEGALLWGEWNDNKAKKCEPGETPLECELRVHRPSIVFMHVGTHYEARNRRYLTIIIERLLENGSVPVLVTKADNTELDERINANIVSLAAEYDLPLWNFWASVSHLPGGALQPGSNMYLTDEALVIHRDGALQALDIVWRAVR